MANHWKDFLSDQKRIVLFVIIVVFAFILTSFFSQFMVWNENRPGAVIQDPILKVLRPINLSSITMSFTILPIFCGMILIFKKPVSTVYFFFTVIFICLMRTLTIFLVPLEPPLGIIPLSDPVIEKLFYNDQVILKDLFFSGHTANLVVIGLLSEWKSYKYFIFVCAFIVGCLLMKQHVHYTMDVIAAPFFAFLAYKWGVLSANKILLQDFKAVQCTGCIFKRVKLFGS